MSDWLPNPHHHRGTAIRQFSPAARIEQDHRFDDHMTYVSEDICHINTYINSSYTDQKQEEDPTNYLIDVDAFKGDQSPAEIDQTALDRGLELVHALLACAEAIGCRDTRLASSLLDRIRARACPSGDPLQRVSHYFATGLSARLSLLEHLGPNNPLTDTSTAPLVSADERAEAFRLLHQTTPFAVFGHAAANAAILRASQGADALHIVDLGMEHALQWPPLLRSLASRATPTTVRITGLGVPADRAAHLEASMASVVEEARALGVRVDFRALCGDEDVESSLEPRLRRGEALYVNAAARLHRYERERLKEVLRGIRRVGPALVTVAEQDADHNGPFFVGRFVEAIHYYAAVFDSLEGVGRGRGRVEGWHFGEEIREVVAGEGRGRRMRHERAERWRRVMGRAGFQGVGVEEGCMGEVRRVVAEYGGMGYTVAAEKGCLLLGWKGRPIMMASAWRVHPSNSSSST
ncbi:DELLA protein GAI1 [Acorus gramineus]|uniref:DELLA protein GAI1 n=1 Tax=Acorus gramineus TaxID=55184 RepID=A0AAV9BRH4_ACOGR|nr:DELLA protein GAI1 [Acorus gramineus]